MKVIRGVFYVFTLLLAAMPTQAFEKLDNGVQFDLSAMQQTGAPYLKVLVLSDNVVQIVAAPSKELLSPVSLITKDSKLKAVPFATQEWRSQVRLSTAMLRVTIDINTGQISIEDLEGNVLLNEGFRTITPATVAGEQTHHVRQGFDWAPGEALYGLGQHQEGIYNWRGDYVELFQYNLRAIVPFLLSSKGYGILWDNYSYTKFDDSVTEPYLWSEVGDAVNYTFIYGPGPNEAIARYRELTGQAPMFPKWAFGYIQSKERYNTQQELLEIAAEFRKREIPMDCLVQDWRYWDDGHWGQKSFNAEKFPDPAAMMRTLHADYNTRLMISVWPKMSFRSPNYAEMLQHEGFLYPGGKDRFYDAFNPAARALYWRQANEGIFSKGIDAWWCDATEPELDDWDFNIDAYKRDMKPVIGSGARYMNAYSLMHSKGIYENQRATTEDKRVVNLTRSAFAGQQKYATITWSGDINATWEVFRNQVPAGLNFCMSGLPYWTTDIGGFFVQSKDVGPLGRGRWFREGGFDAGVEDDGYKELYVRWFQYGAFCPVFRSHGTDIDREPWRFGEPGQWAFDALLKADHLRYRLMPYIYSSAWQVTHEGATMMRGLAMDFGGDPHVYDIGDQFMFGPSIMANPVTRPSERFRVVYLPEGADWYSFWNGKKYTGGQTFPVPAPIDEIPLFVRAGAIVPMGPVIQHAGEKADPTELRVYPGADGRFVLYEDEGDNYNYEQGKYATIELTWDDAGQMLKIGARQGSFEGMLEKREFRVVLVGTENGKGVEQTEEGAKVVEYDGSGMSVDF